MGDASEWVAAGAALAAAAVVAWQSWETRRSAQASEKAVDAAERAVLAANEGLGLSRQQVAEATRARIDAATPTITVMAPEEPDWPPLEPSVMYGGEPQPLVSGVRPQPWHLPRDGATRILVRTPVSIHNTSSVPVTVGLGELTDKAGQPTPDTVDLDPGESRPLYFAVTRTLSEWVAVYRQRAAGEVGDDGVGFVRFSDAGDTGVIDRWELRLAGTPVEPVPDLDGAWRLIAAPDRFSGRPGAMGVSPAIRQRLYYLSKLGNQPLER